MIGYGATDALGIIDTGKIALATVEAQAAAVLTLPDAQAYLSELIAQLPPSEQPTATGLLALLTAQLQKAQPAPTPAA